MDELSLPAPLLVDTSSALLRLADTLKQQPCIAVDTESNSLYAYRERVCLIQFSIPGADFLVDPLALADLSPLEEIFASPRIEKVFHASDYDIYGLNHDFGFSFANLYDTMIAARTLGFESLGLNNLLLHYFGVELDKRFQKANWGERPLMAEMVNYARFDTHYLLALRDRLDEDLREQDRWQLAHEDFVRCAHVLLHNGDPRERWERINGHLELDERQRTILHELCLFRERMAEKLDRPLFKVISDSMLLEIARRAPASLNELTETGLSERQTQRFGRALLEAVARGQSARLVRATLPQKASSAQITRLQQLKRWRKEAAKALGVESDVILPRTTLQAIVAENPRTLTALKSVMAESPWRFEQYGTEILKALGVRYTEAETQP
ncbi:MAG: ribonuclease D [Anaerolineales bacterium]